MVKNSGIFLLGLIFALLVLEFSLSTFTKVARYQQLQRNKLRTADDEFVILCLGESTTASMCTVDESGRDNSWPTYLAQNFTTTPDGQKIKVINEGLMGVNSLTSKTNFST